MQKLNMRSIKKQMAAAGLAATLAFAMTIPSYARSLSDPGAVGWQYKPDEVNGLKGYYIDSPYWLGSYDIGINGYEYQITISSFPDDTDHWMVEACRIPDGKGYSDAAWTGYFYTDPAYNLSVTNETGAIMTVLNWNGDETNPDVQLTIACDPFTDQIYLQAYPLHSIPNSMTGFPEVTGESAFAPQPSDPNAPVIVYKKISDAYRTISTYTFSDGRTVCGPTGWTTNGVNTVEEPWWFPGATSSGSGVG